MGNCKGLLVKELMTEKQKVYAEVRRGKRLEHTDSYWLGLVCAHPLTRTEIPGAPPFVQMQKLFFVPGQVKPSCRQGPRGNGIQPESRLPFSSTLLALLFPCCTHSRLLTFILGCEIQPSFCHMLSHCCGCRFIIGCRQFHIPSILAVFQHRIGKSSFNNLHRFGCCITSN